MDGIYGWSLVPYHFSESKIICVEFGCRYRIEILNRSYEIFQNLGDESVMALRAEISALKIEEESDKKKLELMQTQARENEESLEETVAEFVDAAGVLTSAIDTADRNADQFLASIFILITDFIAYSDILARVTLHRAHVLMICICL